MKIEKSYLKQIIKEEIQKITESKIEEMSMDPLSLAISKTRQAISVHRASVTHEDWQEVERLLMEIERILDGLK